MHNTALQSKNERNEVERSALGYKDPEMRTHLLLCVNLEFANYLQKNIEKFYDHHAVKVKATCFSYL